MELPKFKRGLEDLRGLTDEWLFFVGSAGDLDDVPARFVTMPEISSAFHIAETARLTPEEDHALELKIRWIADQKMILAMKNAAEAKAHDAEAKAHDAEAKAHDAEAKAHDAEAKAHDAEAKAHDAEAKAHDAETKAHHYLLATSCVMRELGLDDGTIAARLGISVEDVQRLRG